MRCQWASVDLGLTWFSVASNAGFGRKTGLACAAWGGPDLTQVLGGLLLVGGRDALTGQDSADVFVALGPVLVDAGPPGVNVMIVVLCTVLVLIGLFLLGLWCFQRYCAGAAVKRLMYIPLLRRVLTDQLDETTSLQPAFHSHPSGATSGHPVQAANASAGPTMAPT